MGQKINVLSFAVANLIAAGEVVDRPASAIKELMENSIDAGASSITVEIQNGGVTFMRVTDDGCGIEAEDLPMAVRRHATSKIKEATDLDTIMTLGFRGEALAAISAVADVRIISKTEDKELGSMIEVSFGDVLGVSERGCSKGTTVIVENLFENVPARRKFLKRDITEAMAVAANVEKIALSHPEVAIKLISDGNIKLETAGDGKVESAIYSVFGREFVKKLIKVDSEVDGIRVKGYIGRSDNVKGNRNSQNFFLNGRYIKSRTASAAIEQAYVSYVPPEKFPCCVLNIIINPMAVDVNVHPSKLEVKFSNEKAVFEAVYYTVKSALEENKTRPTFVLPGTPQTHERLSPKSQGIRMSDLQIPVEEAIRGESAEKRQISIDSMPTENSKPQYQSTYGINTSKNINIPERTYESHQTYSNVVNDGFYGKKESEGSGIGLDKNLYNENDDLAPFDFNSGKIKAKDNNIGLDKEENNNACNSDDACDINIAKPNIKEESNEKSSEDDFDKIHETLLPQYRIVGEVFNCYVIVELADKILLVDKHAAHERINYERLKAGMKKNVRPAQLLMVPIDIMLTSQEVQVLNEYRSEIESLGFDFSTARNTVSVNSFPQGLDSAAIPDMISTMADRLKSGTGNPTITREIIFEKALFQASCKASIKGGREYPPEYVQWVIAKLMEIPDITFCPHGRPVAMEITKKNLERQFGRE